MANRLNNNVSESAILYIAKMLPAHASLTIHSFDEYTGVVFVEAANTEVDDVRVRIKNSMESYLYNPNFDESVIDQLISDIDRLSKEVKQYNKEYNKEMKSFKK